MDVLRRAGIVDLLGENAFYQAVTDAVSAATEVEEQPAHAADDDVRAEVAGSYDGDSDRVGEEL